MLTPNEHNQQIAVLEQLLRGLRENAPPRCCANCAMLINGVCGKYGAIAQEFQSVPGCPDWEEEIPF